jgi:hypothetical protein
MIGTFFSEGVIEICMVFLGRNDGNICAIIIKVLLKCM